MLTTARPGPPALWLDNGLPEAEYELPRRTDEASAPSATQKDHGAADINRTVPPGD